MTTLPKNFIEFIELLSKNNVRYIIIGGYAAVYHGYVRSTNAIDIWIDIRKDNIKIEQETSPMLRNSLEPQLPHRFCSSNSQVRFRFLNRKFLKRFSQNYNISLITISTFGLF